MKKKKGLYNRYIIGKANGKTVDPEARYFIMRYDDKGRDPYHINACQKAILTYCDEIEEHLPQLAEDLRKEIAWYDNLLTGGKKVYFINPNKFKKDE